MINIKELIKYRRHLHKYPEIGFETTNTINFIFNEINNIDYNKDKIKLLINKINNNLIVTLSTKNSNILGFRADIDALEIKETNNISYKSTNNYMHACGHDAHTAISLRVITYLLENPTILNGTVRFIFQNAEEGPNEGGAFHLIENDLIKEITSIFALHVNSELEPFTIYYRYNEIMAQSNMFKIELFGKSSHITRFKEGIDVLKIGIKIYNKIMNLTKKDLIYIGKFNSGVSSNIVSEYTKIEGSIRTFHLQNYRYIYKKIGQIIKRYSKNNKYKISYNNGYPPVINNKQLTDLLINCSNNLNINIKYLKKPFLLSDDFSRYSVNSQICYFFIGTKLNKNTPLHSSNFTINEDALKTGFDIFIELIKNYPFKYV